MRDIKQINVITRALTIKRNKVLSDIMQINAMIKQKYDLIEKIKRYQNEYSDTENKDMTHMVPAIISNQFIFSGRIFELIERELTAISHLNSRVQSRYKEVTELDMKLEAVDLFHQKHVNAVNERHKKAEQVFLDELSVLKTMRGDNE